MYIGLIIVSWFFACGLAGCDHPRETVVLLETGGHVDVSTRKGVLGLDHVLDTVVIDPGGGMERARSAPHDLEQTFGPTTFVGPRTEHATVYFQKGTELTLESKAAFQALLGRVRPRTIKSIDLVGYTDRLGPDAVNKRLALRRAQVLQRQWNAVMPQVQIHARGPGLHERLNGMVDPLNGFLSEPLDRRVEIIINFE